MVKIFAGLGAISAVLCLICGVYCWYDFSSNCEDYLKLAADAPTIEKADQFLGKALNYMEEKNLTKGNSSIIFVRPKNDVGVWYGQIKDAKESLRALKQNSSQLEKTNTLMKIRETLVDSTKEGTQVTHPHWIVFFPYQRIFIIWLALSLTLLVLFYFCTEIE